MAAMAANVAAAWARDTQHISSSGYVSFRSFLFFYTNVYFRFRESLDTSKQRWQQQQYGLETRYFSIPLVCFLSLFFYFSNNVYFRFTRHFKMAMAATAAWARDAICLDDPASTFFFI
jgi:hypothetical protein